ncbi:hypothetical protein AGR4A_Cc190072 [Agrobacterium tumefaciens str. B6]|uniref:Uncharacterized protein n=1 Tax=Agrobacterium tumefaciens str. B6 TaxID=1183423 RepID=A0A822UW04_AGRTU|nr:hypothetical protein AGR4A_Cc190072 [Agrobacterium tumefaciens str. B6]
MRSVPFEIDVGFDAETWSIDILEPAPLKLRNNRVAEAVIVVDAQIRAVALFVIADGIRDPVIKLVFIAFASVVGCEH